MFWQTAPLQLSVHQLPPNKHQSKCLGITLHILTFFSVNKPTSHHRCATYWMTATLLKNRMCATLKTFFALFMMDEIFSYIVISGHFSGSVEQESQLLRKHQRYPPLQGHCIHHFSGRGASNPLHVDCCLYSMLAVILQTPTSSTEAHVGIQDQSHLFPQLQQSWTCAHLQAWWQIGVHLLCRVIHPNPPQPLTDTRLIVRKSRLL